ncbi:hypothetical protein G9A89_020509 [Geosiphon pyriformis]|nr:hypothetical protein G9A89_020509 [Geosiphon pyriformis]
MFPNGHEVNGTSSETNSFNSGSKSFPIFAFQKSFSELEQQFRALEGQIKEKDEMIKKLREEVMRLDSENKGLKSGYSTYSYPPPKFPPHDRFPRVPELKEKIIRAVDKVFSEFLPDPSTSHPVNRQYPHQWVSPSPGSNAVTPSPLPTQPSTPDRSVDDNSSINIITPYEGNTTENKNLVASYQNSHGHASESESLREATDENLRDQHHNHNNHINENDGDAKSSSPNTTSIMNNRKSAYTAFVSWTGQMSADVLRSLFKKEDVKDIRQSPNKSFAHIDFTSDDALKRALELNGMSLAEHGVPGALRVEKGKPRENGQRPQQYQYTNQNQNPNLQNKNRPGFNNPSSFGNGPPKINGHNETFPRDDVKMTAWNNFPNNTVSLDGPVNQLTSNPSIQHDTKINEENS